MPRVERERVGAFLAFVWRRFLDDRCLEIASSLSYTSVVALVPLTAIMLGVAGLFPLYQHGGDRLTAFLFHHFVPGAASSLSAYVRLFAHSARGLTGWGAAGVLVTTLLTMATIEDAFNRIWRVPTRRRMWARGLIYLAAILFGPLLGVAILAFSSYLVTLPLVATAEQAAGLRSGLHLLPGLLEWITFTVLFVVVPNRSVKLLHALAGGALAAVGFEASKFVIAIYLAHASYRQVYGAVAMVPIFVLWIWVAWLVVLFGASCTAALAAFRYVPAVMRLPRGFELYAVLRLLGRLALARRDGQGLHSARMLALEPLLEDDLLQHALAALVQAGIVARDADGAWRLLRDLDAIGLGEFYTALGLPVPLRECVLPLAGDALGRGACAALDALRQPLRAHMECSLGSIFRVDHPALQESSGA